MLVYIKWFLLTSYFSFCLLIIYSFYLALAIGKITAYDADIGRNAEITFTLIQCIAYGLNTFNSSDSIVHESYENYLSNKKNFSQSLEIMYT